MKNGKGVYYFLSATSLAGCLLLTYGMIFAPINVADKLTYVGLLIATSTVLFSAGISLGNIDDKERNRVELEKIKNSLSDLASSIENTNKKLEVGSNEINNEIKSVLHAINEKNNSKNNYSLLTINSESKKDLERK